MTDSAKGLPADEAASSASVLILALLTLLTLFGSLSLCLLPHSLRWGSFGLAVLGVAAMAVVFLNVERFLMYAFPFIFIIPYKLFLIPMVVLLMVSFFANRLKNSDLTWDVPRLLPLGLFIVAAFYGLSRSKDPALGRFYLVFSVLLPLLCFFLIYNLRLKWKDIQLFLVIICVLSSAVGWLSMARYLSGAWSRAVIGWSANSASFYYGMLTPFALIALLDARSALSRLFCWVVLLGLLGAIFVTQSRAIYFSLFAALCFMALKERRVFRIMVPVILAVFLLAPMLLIYRMAMMFGVGEEVDWSSVGRLQIWTNALTLIPRYFWFGMGIDSFRSLYPSLFPASFVRALHPHNIYLRMLFDFGIFGLIGFVWLIISILKPAFRQLFQRAASIRTPQYRLLLAAVSSVLMILLAGMVDAPTHHPRVVIMFWMLLAMILMLTRQAAQREDAP